MPSKIIKYEDGLYDEFGSPIRKFGEGDNKYYAVITRCGHCGNGYYIPIMFSTRSKNMETAIDYTKASPRVKRDKIDAIIDAFEVTADESFFIKAINDHDAYLKNFLTENDEEARKRRVPCGKNFTTGARVDDLLDSGEVKTADMYDDYCVLQRAYAPSIQGGRLVYPKRVNKEELLHEYFRQSTIRLGIKKNNGFFPMMYYLVYGKENDLGFNYVDSGYMTFKNDGKIYTLEIPEVTHNIRKDDLIRISKQQTKTKKEFDFDSVSQDELPKRPSQTDKFNKRFQKFMQAKKEEPVGSQPGEE